MEVGARLRIAIGAVAALALGAGGMYFFGPGMRPGSIDHEHKQPPSELRLDRSDRAYPLSGMVTDDSGDPLRDVTVSVGDESIYTDETGTFSFDAVPFGPIALSRPGYLPTEYTFDGSVEDVDIPMEARIVRAIHISSTWAVDDAEVQRLIDLADVTTVNAFVYDAMGDDGFIDYTTKVQAAIDHNMITDTPYDLGERLQQAEDAGLYTIVRITTFANPLYVRYYPQQSLGGGFMDPGNHDAWEYPLGLAEEACQLGADEVNFDYIRYPSHFYAKTPTTQEGRVANIRAFLQEAADRLHAMGCALSANSFGGVTMSDTDYGIGQLVEDFSAPIDAYAPMTYPDLWSPGDFGFDNPTNHPKEVVAAQLDAVAPRVAPGVVVRPWLRASYWPDSWILVQIEDAEERGMGWIMWSDFHSLFRISSFPAGTTGEG